ncbi:hypothetical protein SprV_0702350200 [Sparganum proliferum]
MTYLSTLGGGTTTSFVLGALFSESITRYVTFCSRQRGKRSFFGSPLYNVVLEVFDQWDQGQCSDRQQLEIFQNAFQRAYDRYLSPGRQYYHERLPASSSSSERTKKTQENADYSLETIPQSDKSHDGHATFPSTYSSKERQPTNDKERILLLMCRHIGALSSKLDNVMESLRKVMGRQRLLETMILQRPTTSGQLLTSFLICLGGHNLDDFVKRIFFALFDDEINMRVNFQGRETREDFSESKRYEVFSAWNTSGSARLSSFECVFTKRPKKPLDSYVQRLQKTRPIRWQHSRNVFQ